MSIDNLKKKKGKHMFCNRKACVYIRNENDWIFLVSQREFGELMYVYGWQGDCESKRCLQLTVTV